MDGQIIPLYGDTTGGGGCGLSANSWSTLPISDANGFASEGTNFILPAEFEYRQSKFGNFIVHRESGEMMHPSAAFDGSPMLHTPDGRHVVLERA